MRKPQNGAIVLPDGTTVRGRGRREPLPAGPLPEFGLLLASRTGQRPDWPTAWVDWPDFGTPRDDRFAAAAVEHAFGLAQGGRRVEVVCGGGTGRTGTVIACMAVLAGLPAAEAVEWTRRHYRRRAVETPGQRRWVEWFGSVDRRNP